MSYMKFISILVVFILGFIHLPAQARIICWTNKDGIRECADKVLPEAAQNERQELNEQGLVIDEIERAKSEAEVAAEKKRAEEEAEKQRQAEEQARQDKILLDTFSNVDDINVARDGKIAALDTSISLAQKRIEKLQLDLDELVEQAAANERAGKNQPEHLLQDIENLRRQIADNNEFITDKHTEQEMVKEEYAQHVERFKKLKSLD